MTKRRQAKSDIFDRLGSDTIILAGEPGSLRTNLMLVNPGQDRLVIREAALRLQPLNGDNRPPAAAVTLSATIPPGGTQRTRLSLDMDPYTPPGEYRGELEVAGQTRPVIIYIVEVIRLEIWPASVIIDVNGGESVTKQVIFKNGGNVPLTIGQPGKVTLGQEVLLPRSLMGSVAPVDVQQKQLESLFAEVIDITTMPVIRDAGFLEVHNPNAPLVIKPGEVGAVALELRLPKKLEPNTRYLARLPLYNATLEFAITPIGQG
jgi:hypothetical protein